MENKKIIIVGAGGFSIVVAETAMLLGFRVIGFADDHKALQTVVMNNLKVVSSIKELSACAIEFDFFIVAIGDNIIRKRIFNELLCTSKPTTLIHPNAFVSPLATINKGSIVQAGAVINANTTVEDNCIINSQVLLDHDSSIASHCHIAQGTIIGSNVTISQNTLTTIGQIIPSFSEIS